MAKYAKCDKRRKVICSALEERLNSVNARAKGFAAFVTINLKTGRETFVAVVYRTKSSDHGMILNFCPWCGRRLGIIDRSALKKKKTLPEV